ncbi:MAG TPA: hypothetical protein VLB84_00200 [Bacteroidia bacterium]|nr:hypothetical protein [Bacteroidia bacterium]
MHVLAFFIEQFVLRGIENFEEVGGFEQARRTDIIRAGRVERRNVGQQFRVNDDLRGGIQFAHLPT